MTDTITGTTADDTREWLDHSPIAALECRTLRHSWPRMTHTGSRARTLPASGPVAWKILGHVTAGRLTERTMQCAGGCGVQRTETFLILHDGRMVRDGQPRYTYPDHYLRKRTRPDETLDPIGPDELLGAIVHRLYPHLRW